MSETKNNIVENKVCDCEAVKAELEQTKAKLEEATALNAKYEEAYSQLVARYNRLRTMLDNTIEFSLGVK